jgi:hypothetical protein
LKPRPEPIRLSKSAARPGPFCGAPKAWRAAGLLRPLTSAAPSGKKNRVATQPRRGVRWPRVGSREKLGHAEIRVRTVGKQKCNAHSVATHAHAGWPKATYSRKMTDSTADVGSVTGSTETAPPRAGHQREVINYIHGRKTQPGKKRPPATNTPHKPREATPRWPRRCPRRPSSTHRSKWPDRYGC